MIILSKLADYGVIVAAHLAAHSDRQINAAALAAETRLPQATVAKVLKSLARARIVSALRGATGGYRLARDARDITTLEVIRCIDGPIILTQCFTEHDEPIECDQSEMCPVREPLRKVHEGILRLLSGITISDLSSDDMPIPAIQSMVSSIQPSTRPIPR